jgi:hypothetical protein
MSPQVLQPLPDNSPPRFYPVEYHPEFGYLAPTLRFRSKLSLMGKGAAFGLIVGIIVAIAASPDRQEQLRATFRMQTEAATSDWPAIAPLRFVAATLAMRDARASERQTVALPAVETPAPVLAVEPVAALPEPAPTPQKAGPKSKKKIARRLRQEGSYRRAESDPRSAYAGPRQRKPQPQSGWSGGRTFGSGW